MGETCIVHCSSNIYYSFRYSAVFARTTPEVSDRVERELGTANFIYYDTAPRNSVDADGIDTKSVTMETYVNFLRSAPQSPREVIFETGGAVYVGRLYSPCAASLP